MSSLSSRRVLMIAYNYPPEGGSSGVLRALKFSKYLPESGWIPHVLTLKKSFYRVRDDNLLADIPGCVSVHRTRGLDTARHLAIKGRHLALLAVPDRFVGWIPFAVARGLKVIRRENIDLIYSTCPPPSSHLIALALKKITGIPWVADFRDPWIEEGIFPSPGTLRYRIESALEKRVVGNCDLLVATTPYLRNEFLTRYPELSSTKTDVIYNGYDEPDFAALNNGVRAERFDMIHAGLVTEDFRNPLPLLKVIARVIGTGAVSENDFRVSFIGGGSWVGSDRFQREVQKIGLEGIVRVENRISHRAALQRMAKAAVLLLLQASEDTRSLIPAKAFEYLRIGRPILALTLPGATADLLKGVPGCYAVDPSNPEALTEALRKLYDLWRREDGPIANHAGLEKYERRNLTKELARLFDALVEQTFEPRN